MWAWLRPRGCFRQESCRGPGKGLAVASWSSPARVLPGVSWVSLARILPRIIVFWLSSSLVCFWSPQRSACHHGGASRASVPKWLMVLELLGSRVAALLVLGKLPRQGSCRGCGGRPGKGLAGGAHLALLLFVFLAWRCSGCLVALLPSSAPLGVAAGAAPTARAQVKGYKIGPLLLCTDRSPRAWAIHKRDALLG